MAPRLNTSYFTSNSVALLAALCLVCLATLSSLSAEARPMAGSGQSATVNGESANQINAGLASNLDNLISDFLDDAGDRLKKSKLNGMRPIKQTLRFGRRSDPWLAPNIEAILAARNNPDAAESQLLAELGY